MSITEQAGKVVDALKTSPALLVLVLLQAGTLGVIYLSVQKTQERVHERELAMIERCFPLSHTKD